MDTKILLREKHDKRKYTFKKNIYFINTYKYISYSTEHCNIAAMFCAVRDICMYRIKRFIYITMQ